MNECEKCIVMVDDEKGACDTIKSFLQERGYAVYVAYNGDDGLSLIKEKKPILVFLDIRMLGKNGVEVLSELREEDKETKVILMTGLGEGNEIEESQALGISGILNKPVQIRQVLDIVKENL